MASGTPSRVRIATRPGGGGTKGPDTEVQGTRSAAAETSLREELQQILAQNPTREAFAEEAVRVLGKTGVTKAVALLAYDSRRDRLKLIASDGLDADALPVLSGDGMTSGWDIPLRALRNRRINVIESAQTNPFVPKPIININPRQLTVAAIPFYHNNLPIGVGVFFSPTIRGFSDALLQSLSLALKVCGAALAELPTGEQAPRGLEPAGPREQPAALLQGVATLKHELARLTRALDEAERNRAAEAAERITAESFLQAERERVAALEKELFVLREEHEQLKRLRHEAQELDGRLRQVTADRAAAQTELQKLREEVELARKRAFEAEQAAKDESSTVEALISARDELQRQLDRIAPELKEREAALTALQQRNEELNRQIQELSALPEKVVTLEKERNALAADLERARESLKRIEDEQSRAARFAGEASEQLRAAQGEIQRLTAQLREAQSRAEQLEKVQKELGTLQAKFESAEQGKNKAEQELEAEKNARRTESNQFNAKIEEWTKKVGELEQERVRLREDLNQIRSRASNTEAELTAKLAALDRERKQLTERVEQLAKAEAERALLAARVEEIEGELAAAKKATTVLEGRVNELNEANTRLITERRELHAQIKSLTEGGQTLEQEKQAAINAAQARVTELESALARMAKTLDGVRSSNAEELNRLRTELAAASAAQETANQNALRLEQELASRKQELAELAVERERQRASLEQLRQEHAELVKRSEATVAELAAVAKQREEAMQRIAVLEAQHHDFAKERDSLAAKLEETKERLTSEASAQLRIAEEERKKLEVVLAEERNQHATEIHALNEQLTKVRLELHEQLEQMMRKHEAAEKTYQAEVERLARALAEKEALLKTVEERLISGGEISESEAGVEIDADLDSVMLIDRNTGGDEAAEELLPVEHEGSAAVEILIIDAAEIGSSAATQLAATGFQTSTVVPEAGVLAKLNGKRVACSTINLAVPGAWQVLREMRTSREHANVPVVTYALAPGAATGFWFGPVDFVLLPVTDAMTESLQRMFPKLRRVIGMSADLDLMSAVRNRLNEVRISTAVVFDGRQTLELVPTVRPEAAVLHLSPTCADVFRAISALRSSEISRSIPILFLLDEKAQPREEAFITAGIRMLTGRGNLKADQLIGNLTDSLAPYRA